MFWKNVLLVLWGRKMTGASSQSWILTQSVRPKRRWISTGLHGVAFQRIVLFNGNKICKFCISDQIKYLYHVGLTDMHGTVGVGSPAVFAFSLLYQEICFCGFLLCAFCTMNIVMSCHVTSVPPHGSRQQSLDGFSLHRTITPRLVTLPTQPAQLS
jgi:hypothetical protein